VKNFHPVFGTKKHTDKNDSEWNLLDKQACGYIDSGLMTTF
jgi:hypothetical protein